MTWSDDKEAEHQRIRADFAETELDRLREERDGWHKVNEDRDRLAARLRRIEKAARAVTEHGLSNRGAAIDALRAALEEEG